MAISLALNATRLTPARPLYLAGSENYLQLRTTFHLMSIILLVILSMVGYVQNEWNTEDKLPRNYNPRNPKVNRISQKDERRLVIHVVVRDLLRIMSKRLNQPMGKIVWDAVSDYWLSRGYDISEKDLILNQTSCPTCGMSSHNTIGPDREKLIEDLSRWEDREDMESDQHESLRSYNKMQGVAGR